MGAKFDPRFLAELILPDLAVGGAQCSYAIRVPPLTVAERLRQMWARRVEFDVRWRLRFTLRTALACAFSLAFVFALIGREAGKFRRQHAAMVRVEESGGWIEYFPSPNARFWSCVAGVPERSVCYAAEVRAAGALLDDETLSDLALFGKLQYVKIKKGTLTESAAKTLADCPNLTALSLCNVKISDAVLVRLSRCRGLQTLAMSGALIDDDVLLGVSRLPALRHLSLEHTSVTDRGLASLGSCGTLSHLRILDASVTGVGLRQLAGCRRLEYLDISQSRVGDEGFRAILGQASLKVLYLSGTHITPVGLQASLTRPTPFVAGRVEVRLASPHARPTEGFGKYLAAGLTVAPRWGQPPILRRIAKR